MNYYLAAAAAAIISIVATSSSLAACQDIPANSPLPLTVGPYVLSSTSGMAAASLPDGRVQLQGGITVTFSEPVAGTMIELEGGSVGDVDTWSFDPTGGVLPSFTLPTPESGTVHIPLFTTGVASMDLKSKNNEGAIVSICPL